MIVFLYLLFTIGAGLSAISKLVSVKKKEKSRRPSASEMGRRRWKGLTQEQRSEIARKAVEARWARCARLNAAPSR
jgi:hypothetical protein